MDTQGILTSYEDWADRQRSGWLTRLYGTEDDNGNEVLDPKSPQWAIVGILFDFLKETISAEEAANRLHATFIASPDENKDSPRSYQTILANFTGCFSSIYHHFGQLDLHERLIRLLQELAKAEGKSRVVEIEGLSMIFTEDMTSPMNYLPREIAYTLDQKIITKEPEVTIVKIKWRNIHAFVSLLALREEQGFIDYYARRLKSVVEYQIRDQLPRNVEVIGSSESILIAGEEIFWHIGGKTPDWDKAKEFFLRFANTDVDGVTEDTIQARRTVELMDRIEEQYDEGNLPTSLERLYQTAPQI